MGHKALGYPQRCHRYISHVLVVLFGNAGKYGSAPQCSQYQISKKWVPVLAHNKNNLLYEWAIWWLLDDMAWLYSALSALLLFLLLSIFFPTERKTSRLPLDLLCLLSSPPKIIHIWLFSSNHLFGQSRHLLFLQLGVTSEPSHFVLALHLHCFVAVGHVRRPSSSYLERSPSAAAWGHGSDRNFQGEAGDERGWRRGGEWYFYPVNGFGIRAGCSDFLISLIWNHPRNGGN
jgi:hypothetical protein